MPASDPLPPHLLARRQAIGTRIRAARLDAQLSQEKLAALAGFDRQALGLIEAGRSSALLDTLLRIADVLDVPLSELVRYPDEPETPAARRG